MRYVFFIAIVLLIFVFTACSADRSTTDPTAPPAHHDKRTILSEEGELPDLVITSLTLDLNLNRYTCEFRNVGEAPANLDGPTSAEYDNVSIQGWYSQDTVYQNDQDNAAGGTIIGISPLGWLQPGESRTFSWAMAGFPGGDYCDWNYFLLIIDWGDSVLESDESNNTGFAEICPSSLEVVVDVKPGSDKNPVNLGSRGLIPVAVYGSADFEVADIDCESLAFGPGMAPIAHKAAHPSDLDGDGFGDLLTHFRIQETGLEIIDQEACLTGLLLDGSEFTGCDSFRVVPEVELVPVGLPSDTIRGD